MTARSSSALLATSLALLVAGSAVGCREIVGVPSASSLSDIERTPPLCECGPLEQQPGGSVVAACEAAYASLPDFGEGDPAAPFGSKEAFLASDCAVCRQDDPVGSRDCFAQLLVSTDPGASPPVGSDGSACDSPGDCGSWACCAGDDGGSCCASCVGCSEHVAGEGATPLCVEDAAIFAAYGDCLCGRLRDANAPLICRTECERSLVDCRPDSAACLNCIEGFSSLGPEQCEEEALACQSSAVARPVVNDG